MKKIGQKGVTAAQATFGANDAEEGSPEKDFEFIAESPEQANIEFKENNHSTEPFEVAKTDMNEEKKQTEVAEKPKPEAVIKPEKIETVVKDKVPEPEKKVEKAEII